MKIGFIGAGKVGTTFGHYLHNHGVCVGGYFDRHVEKVVHAAKVTESKTCENVDQVALCSDIIMITTQDDYIRDVCKSLCATGIITNRHHIGHMSGVHASTILKVAQENGASIFSLHPLQTFADEESSLAVLPHTYFSLEGQREQLTEVERIIIQVGNPYFWIDSSHKDFYHLSACVISNYLVTLIDRGLTALEKSGVDRQQGVKAMSQLINGTLNNITAMGTIKALTGPIARGDGGTIERHIEALEAENMVEYKSFYTFLGRLTLDLAAKKDLYSSAKYAEINRLLS